MAQREHSITREGTVAGVVGGALVALWYLVFDIAKGQPLRTPTVLGEMVFSGDFAPPVRPIVPEAVAGMTVVHLLVFVLAGMFLTYLVHLSVRNPAWRMGVWIGLVIGFGLFGGITYMVTTASGNALPAWSVFGGSLVGFAGMAWYLWRRHPRLEQTFREAPLGAEEPAPGHPPGWGEAR
jgi:hypothetical protein